MVFFSTQEDAFRVKRNTKPILINRQQRGSGRTNKLYTQECTFQQFPCCQNQMLSSLLCCRPGPGIHCHTSVECRSSALIDLGALDPVSKVKGPFWHDFCCYSYKHQPKRESNSPTQNNLNSLYVNSSTSSNYFVRTQRFQMRVTQLQVAFSSGGTQIKLRHQYISGPNLTSPSHHIAGTDKKGSVTL